MKKTTATFLLLATIAFSSCFILASAQDDEEWYDPNADYTPDGRETPDSHIGYYLNCDNADKNYFTLQKLTKCGDPYVLSSQNIQNPNQLASHLMRACDYVKIDSGERYSSITEYSNTDNSYTTLTPGWWQPEYDNAPFLFAQTDSKETVGGGKKPSSKQSILDTTPAFLQHKMKQYAANAAKLQQQQEEQQILLETESESKTKTTYPDDGNGPWWGYYTQEDCVKNLVYDPAFRGPVNQTDIERLIAFDILMIINYMYDWRPDMNQRCNYIMLPIWLKYGHFPGTGLKDNTNAVHDYMAHTYTYWYETFVSDRFDYMCYYY